MTASTLRSPPPTPLSSQEYNTRVLVLIAPSGSQPEGVGESAVRESTAYHFASVVIVLLSRILSPFRHPRYVRKEACTIYNRP